MVNPAGFSLVLTREQLTRVMNDYQIGMPEEKKTEEKAPEAAGAPETAGAAETAEAPQESKENQE